MHEVDVLVVGGGPAGLSAAIVLAGCELKTLVCEQKRLPVDKPCGEGLMPTGLADLDRLAVKRHLAKGDYFPFSGIRYIAPSGQAVQAAFKEGPGWGIPRPNLSAALLRRALEIDGLEIRQDAPVRPGDRLKDGRILANVGGEPVAARLLVGADGLNSSVRRWAGLQGRPQPRQRWGARQHFRIHPWSEYVEVYWKGGLEAYITPCGEQLVGVAFLWDRKRYPRLPGGKDLIPCLLAAFPELKARLERASPNDVPRAIGPLQRTVTGPVADGVLLIGDAGGYLDALTGEGISLATAQALALAETVAPRLRMAQGPCLSKQDLTAYAHASQVITRPYYRLTRLALFLSRHPALVDGAIRLLARQPELFQRLLSANMGLA